MKKKLLYYINVFLIYAFIGFIIETLIKYIFLPKMNNGSLNGPWIPIYGLGYILIVIIIKIINRFSINNTLKNIIIFIVSALLISLLEFIGGIILEKITRKVFWRYDFLPLNIGHYMAVEMAIVWGIISLLIKYIFKPKTDNLVSHTPDFVTYLFFIIFLFDLSLTSILKIIK